MATIDGDGNVICGGDPDCIECDDLLCMQIYDEANDTWIYDCENCLEANKITDDLDIEEGFEYGDPQGVDAPTEVLDPGLDETVDCGENSKLIEHTYTKQIQFDIPSPGGASSNGHPWATSVMNGWTGAQRRQMENAFAAQNVPDSVLQSLGLEAYNDGKHKLGAIDCDLCPWGLALHDPIYEDCMRISRHGTIRRSGASGSNGRYSVSGGPINYTLHITLTVKATITMWVQCSTAGCTNYCDGCDEEVPE